VHLFGFTVGIYCDARTDGRQISKNITVSDFMKIRPEGAEWLLHADRQTVTCGQTQLHADRHSCYMRTDRQLLMLTDRQLLHADRQKDSCYMRTDRQLLMRTDRQLLMRTDRQLLHADRQTDSCYMRTDRQLLHADRQLHADGQTDRQLLHAERQTDSCYMRTDRKTVVTCGQTDRQAVVTCGRQTDMTKLILSFRKLPTRQSVPCVSRSALPLLPYATLTGGFSNPNGVFTVRYELDIQINCTVKGRAIALGSYRPACYWRNPGSLLLQSV
jgi:hypothetical protein